MKQNVNLIEKLYDKLEKGELNEKNVLNHEIDDDVSNKNKFNSIYLYILKIKILVVIYVVNFSSKS